MIFIWLVMLSMGFVNRLVRDFLTTKRLVAKVGDYRGAAERIPSGFSTANTATRPLWERGHLVHSSPLNVSRSSTSPLNIYLFPPLF